MAVEISELKDCDYKALPTFQETIASVCSLFYDYMNYNPKDGYVPLANLLSKFQRYELLFFLILPFFWSFLRTFITQNFAKPLAKRLNITTSADKHRFENGIWGIFVFSLFWAYISYAAFFDVECSLFDHLYKYANARNYQSTPSSHFFIYRLKMSYYIYCIYATLYVEERSKDFFLMLFHHIISLFLLTLSHITFYHSFGILTLFLHDNADILLGLCKVCTYSTIQKNKINNRPILAGLAWVTAFLFPISWSICRLYWFPLKVIYSVTLCTRDGNDFRYVVWNIGGLIFLYILNWIWFWFIVVFFYRIFTTGKLMDVRKYDDQTKINVIKHD